MPSGLGEGRARVLILGAGELGKELARHAKHMGLEVIVADRYENAPAMQVADRAHVIDLTAPAQIRRLVEQERPHHILPEVEDLAAFELDRLEQEGWHVVPGARAARLTLEREGIRRLAAEELQLPTSRYFFANSLASYRMAATVLGLPHVIKPTRSANGQGHTTVRNTTEIPEAWNRAISTPRTRTGRVIVEQHIPFDHEFVLLAVRHAGGITFCPPIGHRQGEAGFQESWQSHPMPEPMLKQAQDMACRIVNALGGYGVFGVEFLAKDDQLYFSEVSVGPHDTGLVTLATQTPNQFELHLMATRGQSVPEPHLVSPGACAVILSDVETASPRYDGLPAPDAEDGVRVELFGKPTAYRNRRMGIALATGPTPTQARVKAKHAADRVRVLAPPPLQPPLQNDAPEARAQATTAQGP